jgi:CDP-glucose 4,6-dehydratase|tara:strand:- start:4319 stop:4750 length:432 start_codon:yes stop_codon:yes gene_type:complete
MGGFDPYSSSKGCAELVIEAYRHSFFNPEQYAEHGVAIATARTGNVIGLGDWAKGRLIPDVIDAFINRKSVILRNLESTRPWQHVLESLGAYMLLTERLFGGRVAYTEAWNFGPNKVDTRPTGWVVDPLASYWKEDASALTSA